MRRFFAAVACVAAVAIIAPMAGSLESNELPRVQAGDPDFYELRRPDEVRYRALPEGLPIATDSDGNCAVMVPVAGYIATPDDLEDVYQPELIGIPALEAALTRGFPCEYSSVSVDNESRQLLVHMHSPSDELTKGVESLAAEWADDVRTRELFLDPSTRLSDLEILVVESASPRYLLEQVRETVVNHFIDQKIAYMTIGYNADGIFRVWLPEESAAETHRALTEREAEALLRELIEPYGVPFELEIFEGSGFETFAETQFSLPPERPGQRRATDTNGTPGGTAFCSSGPSFVTGGSVRGQVAGHCGAFGMGIFGGNVNAGQAVAINPVAGSCGWTSGQCFADSLWYPRRYSGGHRQYIYGVGTTKGVQTPSSAGPGEGVQVCSAKAGKFNNQHAGWFCRDVATQSTSSQVPLTNGNPGMLDILYSYITFQTNQPTGTGDSGAISSSYLSFDSRVAWGTVSAGNSQIVIYSHQWWAAYGWGWGTLVCGSPCL